MFDLKEILAASGGTLLAGKTHQRFAGFSIDSRSLNKGDIFIALQGGNFDGHDFIAQAIEKGAACIISEFIPAKLKDIFPGHGCACYTKSSGFQNKICWVKVKDTTRALGDIACFYRSKFSLPVVAVTGSNGKTTAKEMISWVLSMQYQVLKNEGTKNNHIGLPQTLLNLNENHELAVVELGTNHPGEIRYLSGISRPNIGVITNIGPSHLEHFGDLSGVLKEKYSLVDALDKPAIAILNADDQFLYNFLRRKAPQTAVMGFGIERRSDFSVSNIVFTPKGLEFMVNSRHKIYLNTLGRHNIYNALASICLARIFGMDYNDIEYRLSIFDFPAGRLKLMKFLGATFIDDTYNSNPLSLNSALDVMENFHSGGRKIVVMGDMLELGQGSIFLHRKAVKKAWNISDILITVGEFSNSAGRLIKSGISKKIFICDSSLQARECLLNKISLRKDDVVLVKGSRGMKMERVFE